MAHGRQGILQLHEHNPPILHRDMKTANVLVDSGWHCKISDFNLSYMEGTPAVLCHSAADNPRYMAPEVPHISSPSHNPVATWQLPLERMHMLARSAQQTLGGPVRHVRELCACRLHF